MHSSCTPISWLIFNLSSSLQGQCFHANKRIHSSTLSNFAATHKSICIGSLAFQYWLHQVASLKIDGHEAIDFSPSNKEGCLYLIKRRPIWPRVTSYLLRNPARSDTSTPTLGKPMTMGQHVLDKGAEMMQSLKPVGQISQHVCTFALYSHDLTRQIETHHYVHRLNQDFL